MPGLTAMSITGSSDSRNRAPIAARHCGSRRAAFSHSKQICCDVSGDIGFEFLKSSANYSLNYSLYYSVEVFFMGGRNLSSYPLGSFLHTPAATDRQPVDKSIHLSPQLLKLAIGNPAKFPGGVNRALVLVLDRDRDEAFLFERRDVGGDLAWADAEELGEVTIGGEAAALVIERVDFHKQHLFHE